MRHPHASGVLRLFLVTLVWLGGLVTGLFTILALAAKYSCAKTATGLACTSGGTGVGGVLLVVVIATVATATVLSSHGRPARIWACAAGAAVILSLCFLGARALLNTA